MIGGKAHGLVVLHRLGLSVPPAFVIDTGVCRAFLRDGRPPAGFDDALRDAVAELEAATGRRLGGAARPLALSVRSGAGTSMPGMMDTVLNLGLTTVATDALARETGDRRFALDARSRFLTGYARAVHGASSVTEDAFEQLAVAVRAVFASWDSARARTYRRLHDIPHDLGTAVTVQAMVFGNRDERSGSGVAFSRDPNTGAPVPYGEVLFRHQGDDVVAGGVVTRELAELAELAEREPDVWAELVTALARVEEHHRDVCHLEFTFETGVLWILQVRRGGLAAPAAVRVAVDLVDEGVIDEREAVRRITPDQLAHAAAATADVDAAAVLTRGVAACPGVAVGRVATTAEAAVRMAASGPVVLVRPYTSPRDLHGIAAAAGVVTATGGPSSHAAVVARAMGRPAVVGAAGLVVDAGRVRAGERTAAEGDVVTVDGTTGRVALGEPRGVSAEESPHLRRLRTWVGG